MWSWTHANGRWYVIQLERDLLDGVVVVARWGGRARRGFQSQSYPVVDRASLRKALRMLHRRRERHA